jgi:hypothetical protein
MNGGILCRSEYLQGVLTGLYVDTVVSNLLQATPINNDQLSWQIVLFNAFIFTTTTAQPMVYYGICIILNTESCATIVPVVN